MISLLWLIPALPFASALMLALVGSRLSRRAAAAVGVGSIGLSALITILVAVSFFTVTSIRELVHSGPVDLDQRSGLSSRRSASISMRCRS